MILILSETSLIINDNKFPKIDSKIQHIFVN